MPEMPMDPMKFGTEKDFNLALTELKWIKNMNGKLTKHDFETVAAKYQFPEIFLKEGLRGLSFPNDYMISKSKWFPIMYKWNKHIRSLQWQFFKLEVNYLMAGASFIAALISIPLVGVMITSFLYYQNVNMSLLISGVITPIIGLGCAISLWLLKLMMEAKSKLEEFFSSFKSECPNEKVFINIVRQTYSFIGRQGLLRAHILSKRKGVFKPLSLFPIEKTSLPKGLLEKLIPQPRFVSRIEGAPSSGEVPVFLAEDPDEAYAQRVREISSKHRTIKEITSY